MPLLERAEAGMPLRPDKRWTMRPECRCSRLGWCRGGGIAVLEERLEARRARRGSSVAWRWPWP
uniref:Uncharacterized protein n=1 Tax=Arundo donax TaxID=35708 RepID=A0A0A8Y928_ARUDO